MKFLNILAIVFFFYIIQINSQALMKSNSNFHLSPTSNSNSNQNPIPITTTRTLSNIDNKTNTTNTTTIISTTILDNKTNTNKTITTIATMITNTVITVQTINIPIPRLRSYLLGGFSNLKSKYSISIEHLREALKKYKSELSREEYKILFFSDQITHGIKYSFIVESNGKYYNIGFIYSLPWMGGIMDFKVSLLDDEQSKEAIEIYNSLVKTKAE